MRRTKTLTLILLLALAGCAATTQLPADFDPTFSY